MWFSTATLNYQRVASPAFSVESFLRIRTLPQSITFEIRWDSCVFCIALAMGSASVQIPFQCSNPAKLLQNCHVLFIFGEVQNPLPLPHEVCFEVCFAPQRRANLHPSPQTALHPLREPTFRPSAPKHWNNHDKNIVFREFSTCSSIFSSDPFSSLILFLLLFSSLMLPICDFSSAHFVGSWLLNFLR